MPDPLPVAAAAARLDALRSGRSADEIGGPDGQPVLLVDLDRGTAGADLRPPPGWPGVIVGVSATPAPPAAPDGPDVLISAAADPPAPWVGADDAAGAAAKVLAEVHAHPQASTTLVQVLRVGTALSVPAALVVESLAYSTLQDGPEHRAWLRAQPARAADSNPEPAVLVEREGDELSITLDRPERRNAYSARMRDELVAALQLAGVDATIGQAHLRGRGPNFCSGGDLAEFGTRPDPATAHQVRTLRSAGWWIDRLAPKVVVHLHGACVGAGIELAAFAGTVVAAPGTEIMLPEVGMGLIPGAGGTASIPRRIGTQRAAWLAITGARLDAATAQRWGLVDRIG